MNEQWKDIPEFEGFYQASSWGRIKSVERLVKHWQGGTSLIKERVLRPGLNGIGYLKVNTCVKGKVKSRLLHRLIAETFIGPIPKGMVVHHLDNNPLNNNVENLEITTGAKNSQHSVKFRKDNGIKFNKEWNKRPDFDYGFTLEQLNTQIWVPILDYEDLYWVSNLGLVKSIARGCRHSGGGTRTVKENILKPNLNRHGYLTVGFSKGGKKKTYKVHQLVAQAFHGPRPSPNHVINHINHNKLDNRAENLEYVTYQENSVAYQEFKTNN